MYNVEHQDHNNEVKVNNAKTITIYIIFTTTYHVVSYEQQKYRFTTFSSLLTTRNVTNYSKNCKNSYGLLTFLEVE